MMQSLRVFVGVALDVLLRKCQRAALTLVFVVGTGWASPALACSYYLCQIDWLYTCPYFCGYYERSWRWYDYALECFCTTKECVALSFDSPGTSGNCFICMVSYAEYCGQDA
jgi:hypothetical protein